MSQVLPRGDRWAMAGLVLGCVLFGLGSLIIVFVPLGSFAMSFWRLLVGALAFAVLALVWAWFGQLDIVAVAQGKTEPGGQSKVIQPLETAEVKVIHVRDGQHVEAGETLLELRAVGSDADVTQSEKALHAAQLAKWRNEALLAALDHSRPPQMDKAAALQAGIDEADFLQAQLLVSNQYQAWAAQDQQIRACRPCAIIWFGAKHAAKNFPNRF